MHYHLIRFFFPAICVSRITLTLQNSPTTFFNMVNSPFCFLWFLYDDTIFSVLLLNYLEDTKAYHFLTFPIQSFSFGFVVHIADL
jgi:hypothetical protein